MDELQFLGYLITAVITLGAFIAIIMKFIQPINELRIAIQKLIDRMDASKADDDKRDKRLDAHSQEIDQLRGRVDKVETKINIYHGNNKGSV